jgi:SAM-dependent methyltransferase
LKRDLLDILRCPECGGELALTGEVESAGEVESGTLACGRCARSYPVKGFVPRFVPAENYASNFGFQWNRFRTTQLDSHTGLPISRERLLTSLGCTAADLKGRRVLDVGCGAGRFAEVALSAGARLVALDYSTAVDAAFANLAPHPNLDVVQGDIYKLPFRPAQFDAVYCLGVLQHTPDVRKAFLSLPAQVREGGRLAVDAYPKLRLNVLWPKYWLRPLTTRIDARRLFRLVERAVPLLLPLSDLISRLPWVGPKLRYAVPVANHRPAFPQLSPTQVREWAVLDTFDMFGPAYDEPQSAETLAAWCREAGLQQIEVFRKGQNIARAVRPPRPQ